MSNILPIGIDDTTGQQKIYTASSDSVGNSAIIFQNQNMKTGSKIWCGSSTTSSGVATFNPTDDNTGSGNALFTNIYSVQATPSINTSTDTDAPAASIKLIASDKKSITVNVVDGKVLVALGATMEFSPDGTTVYLTIIGD